MMQAKQLTQPKRVRRGDRGPNPIDNPRNAFEAWINPRPDDLDVLNRAKALLEEDCPTLGHTKKSRDGLISTTELFLALIRHYQANRDLPIVFVEPQSGTSKDRGKNMKIGLNLDEKAEWEEVEKSLNLLYKTQEKGECKPSVAMMTLANFYLENRQYRAFSGT